MIFGINGWLAGQVLCKLLIYSALAAIIGGVFCLKLAPFARSLMAAMKNYLLAVVILGLLASILAFFLKVGYLAESGIGGMFDALYLKILWGSSVGTATAWQVSGFGVLVVAVFWLVLGNAYSPTNLTADVLRSYFIWILTALGVLMVVSSIAMVGHSAGLNVPAQIAIGLHVFVGLWWLGSLVPLQLYCSKLANAQLHQLMHRFGQAALVMVLMLIASGGWVALQLFSSPAELVSTNYGRNFLIKISFVIGLLGLALWHKARLVPRLLKSPSAANSLMSSIRIETLIGIAVLVATAILTTLFGPAHAF